MITLKTRLSSAGQKVASLLSVVSSEHVENFMTNSKLLAIFCAVELSSVGSVVIELTS